MKIYLIFTEDGVILSKKHYDSWREIQDEYYEIYKASLGPYTEEEVTEWIESEYSDLNPPGKEQVPSFLNCDSETVKLTFQESQ